MSTIPTTDLSQIRRMQSDDRAERDRAWDEFEARYRRVLDEWCSRRRLTHALPGDLKANVLRRLFVGLRTYDPKEGRFRAWLRQLVENVYKDHIRDLKRHRACGGGTDAIDALLDQLADPNHLDDLARTLDADITDVAERVEAAVRRTVKDKTWRAFQLYYLEGRPVEEVAAELGLSMGAVYQARHSIALRLRKAYRDQNPPTGDNV